MRIWAIWAVQTTFPKDEVWFSLLQLLVVTALLATLAILAVPYVLALRQKSLAVGQGRVRSWVLWTVQTVFPKDEAWFGLPQLLVATALLSTLAILAVPHVLALRQKGHVVTITAKASLVQYSGHDLCLPGRGDLHAVSDCG